MDIETLATATTPAAYKVKKLYAQNIPLGQREGVFSVGMHLLSGYWISSERGRLCAHELILSSVGMGLQNKSALAQPVEAGSASRASRFRCISKQKIPTIDFMIAERWGA